jgi:hypothetical protein
MVLSEKQEKIVLLLARFKFLTTSQMMRLGIDKHRSNLSTALSPLCKGASPLVKTIDFGLIPKKGRVESLYYLTKKGADIVKNQFQVEAIKFPLGRTVSFTSDYFHRVATIECEVSLYLSSQTKNILFSHRYFDQKGSNRSGDLCLDTKIVSYDTTIISDWVFMLETKKQAELYCAEIYMDDHDASRPFFSLRSYLHIISEGAPSIKYHFNRSNRVLAVFGTERTMFSVLKKIQSDPEFQNFSNHFLFKSLENISSDFHEDWIHIDGRVGRMW